MTTTEVITALRGMKVQTGSLICFGCGYEHDCGIHGCRIIREATAQLERADGDSYGERKEDECGENSGKSTTESEVIDR